MEIRKLIESDETVAVITKKLAKTKDNNEAFDGEDPDDAKAGEEMEEDDQLSSEPPPCKYIFYFGYPLVFRLAHGYLGRTGSRKLNLI